MCNFSYVGYVEKGSALGISVRAPEQYPICLETGQMLLLRLSQDTKIECSVFLISANDTYMYFISNYLPTYLVEIK